MIFGVVAVVLDGHPYQVASFRREGPYLDGRRPSYVEPADAPADARRRDFTINALLYDPLADEVLDLVDGRADLDRRLIRTVGDPAARLGEDRLRMLRAVRFAAELGFAIDPAALAVIVRQAGEIRGVSAERIRQAKEVGAQTLAVGCPFCMIMLTDAAKAEAPNMLVRDVVEIIVDNLVTK